jgi:hypothetical protein
VATPDPRRKRGATVKTDIKNIDFGVRCAGFR